MTFNDSASRSRRLRVTTTPATAPSGSACMSAAVRLAGRRRGGVVGVGLAEAFEHLAADVLERVPALVAAQHLAQAAMLAHPALVHPHGLVAQLQQQLVGVAGEHEDSRAL